MLIYCAVRRRSLSVPLYVWLLVCFVCHSYSIYTRVFCTHSSRRPGRCFTIVSQGEIGTVPEKCQDAWDLAVAASIKRSKSHTGLFSHNRSPFSSTPPFLVTCPISRHPPPFSLPLPFLVTLPISCHPSHFSDLYRMPTARLGSVRHIRCDCSDPFCLDIVIHSVYIR